MKNNEQAIMNEINNITSYIETLSIGVTMTIGEYAIIDKLANFIQNHPEINIHLHYGNTSKLLELLDQGQISMAIVEGNYPKENYSHINIAQKTILPSVLHPTNLLKNLIPFMI